jgi:hypothetical protein
LPSAALLARRADGDGVKGRTRQRGRRKEHATRVETPLTPVVGTERVFSASRFTPPPVRNPILMRNRRIVLALR